MQTRGVVSTLYDNVDKLMLGVMRDKIKELDYAWNSYLRVLTSDRKFERVAQLVAFGDVPEKGEGADYATDLIRAGWTKDFTHLEYGMGFKATQTALEDDQYDQLTKAAELLAFSARYTQAKASADVLNNGFTATTGTLAPDTNPLFYATHVLKGGGTAANAPSSMSDLSITSLTAALVLARTNNKMESGQIGQAITSFNLVVPPDLEMLAYRLVASAGMPGTAENDINPIKARRTLNVVVDDLLTDTDAWFLIPSNKAQNGLVKYRRVPIAMQPPREDDAGNRLYRVRYRESNGVQFWQGCVGNSGA